MKRNLLALMCCVSAFTQADDTTDINVLKNELNALNSKIQSLETQIKSTDQQFKDLSQSKAKKFSIEPYGYVRVDMAHHFQGADKIFNRINSIPFDDGHNVNGRTLFNVNASRLGLNIQSTEHPDVQAKIEVDFRGGSNQDQLRIRHAYVKLDQWLFGQTTSPFVSADILPEKLDFMANLGGAIQRNPMIQYQTTVNDSTQAWIALEDGSKGSDDQSRLPALTTKVQWRAEDRVSVLSARSLLMQKKTSNDDAVAWGVGLGGVLKLDDKTKLHADYYHVKGDSKYVLFANEGYVLDQKDDDQIIMNEFDSFALGITHQWHQKWRSTLGLGLMYAQEEAYAEISPDANKKLHQGWINVVYQPHQALLYGVEYVHGQRESFSNKQGTDSRLEAMLRYSF